MTRFSAAAAISIYLAFFAPHSAHAQPSTCPAGYELMPDSDTTGSGACVKLHAENCLGGGLTVDGKCLCSGQVVMSGETYLLEYVRGKCVPRQCPVQTLQKDGHCVAGNDTPLPPKVADEEPERRSRCAGGTARARTGCPVAYRRYHHFWFGGGLPRFYYRVHHHPPHSY
jgi:hypothetical protein